MLSGIWLLKYSIKFFLKTLFWEDIFRFTTILRGRYRDLSYAPCPYICIASPIFSIPHRGIHLLQLMNLHWYITITQSSVSITVHSCCCTSLHLDKHMMMYVYHYSVIESIHCPLCFNHSSLPCLLILTVIFLLTL